MITTVKNSLAFIFISFILCQPLITKAQEKHEKEVSEESNNVESTFQNPLLINNQTVDILEKKDIEFTFQQRFGLIRNDNNMLGLYSPSNLRLGLDYGINDWLCIGTGVTKNKNIVDANVKLKLLQQTKSGSMPVSVVYFGEVSRCGLSEDELLNQKGEYDPLNRISYFHELMVARKFNEKLSLQAAVTYSYFNFIESEKENSNLGVSLLGRYKIHRQTSIIVDYDYPIKSTSSHLFKPNLGIGVEFATKNNMVQIFVTNCSVIANDEMRVCIDNHLNKAEFLIGFNIARKWNLSAK